MHRTALIRSQTGKQKEAKTKLLKRDPSTLVTKERPSTPVSPQKC